MSTVKTFCQNAGYKLELLNTKDGLPDRWITAIGQDSSGFLWFGTRKGLARWDGNDFQIYDNLTSNRRRLGFDAIQRIIILKDKIWVSGGEQINVIDLDTDQISQSILTDSNWRIMDIYYVDQQIWINALNLGRRYLLRSNGGASLDTILPSEAYPISNFTGVSVADANTIWFLDSTFHLVRYDIIEQRANRYDSDLIKEFSTTDYFLARFDSLRRLWILRESFKPFDDVVLMDHSMDSPVITKVENEKYRPDILLCDVNYELIEDEFKKVYQKAPALYKSSFVDKNGVYWIGTMDGVIIAKPIPAHFTTYLKEESPGKSFGEQIRGMTQVPEGDIYIGTKRGMFRLPENPPSNGSPDKDKFEKIVSGNVFGIIPSSESNVWFSMLPSVVGEYTSIDNTLMEYNPEQSGLRPRRMLYDHRGRLLIGSVKELFRFDTTDRTFITPINHDGLLIADPMLRTKEGHIIVGSQGGLHIFDSTDQLVAHYTTETSPYLNHNHVYDVIEDLPGKYWVATKGGFQYLNTVDGTVKIYTTDNGLCDNTVACIIKDDNGFLWLSTFDGLSRFDPETELFDNFSKDDGLSHAEFNHASKLKTTDGRILFGSMNGVTVFQPKNIPKTVSHAPLVLTNYTTFNKQDGILEEVTSGLRDLKHIMLKHNNKFFRFEFVLLDFEERSNIKYVTFLEGYDDTWQPAKSFGIAEYNNLPAGDYIFRAKASSGRGTWSSKEIAVKVHIGQVFYKTWWFVTIVILLSIGVIRAISRLRLQQALRLERLRTKIASDLHDEVGSIMTKISMSSELLKAGILEEEDEAQELNQIAEQSRSATSTMSDVIWSIDARSDQMKHLVDRMSEHLDELLSPKNIEYHFVYEGLNLDIVLDVIVRQNIYFTFREAVNNIVKHSDATKVDVSLTNVHNHFQMSIRDNGTTTEKSHKTGQGLRNMAMRAKTISGELVIDKKSGFAIELKLRGI